jgi:aldose 1-epimerase
LKTQNTLLFALLFCFSLSCSQNQSKNTQNNERSTVEKQAWGTADGKQVFLYTLTGKDGMVCKLTNWGATITELRLPDRNGKVEDVVLGFESLDRWLDSDGKGTTNPAYMGCTVGRVCNRIANGQFALDGQSHQLAKNNGPNHLHGGDEGWDKKVWTGEIIKRQDGEGVKFTLTSPDGDENYPGEVKAEVVYVLADDNSLKIEFAATSDRQTPVNMTNHSYFNLAGEGKSTILDHQLKLESQAHTEFDSTGIPNGKMVAIEGTPLDFTAARQIGERIANIPGDPGGYDHNFVLREEKVSEPQLAATLYDPQSGRELQLYTTEVGIQFYSGNYLDGSLTGKSGSNYEKHFGLCLEPQFHPDSPNQPDFPNAILKPGEQYEHKCVYKFGVRE